MENRVFTVGPLVPNRSTYVKVQQPKQPAAEKDKESVQNIIVFQSEKKFDIHPVKGQLLLDTALQQGQALKYKCRKGTCGVCTVKMHKGATRLLPPNEKEQKKLKQALSDGHRLACQSIIK